MRPLQPILTVALALTTAAAAASTIRLDADAAAARALEVSHRLSAAHSRVEVAGARVEAADAGRYPTVSADGSVAYRSEVDTLQAPLGPGGAPVTLFPNIQETAAVGVQLTQPLYLGGAVDAERRAARHDREGAEADRRTSAADLDLEARSAYWSAVAAWAAVDASRAEVDRAGRLAADTRSLRDAGMAVRADLLAADARVAAAELRLVQALAAADDADARLRSLLAVPAGDTVELADRGLVDPPPPPAPLERLQAEAIGGRAELEALGARIRVLEAQRDAARAPLRPSVSAIAGWDLARPNQRHLPLRDEWQDSWSVGLTASWRLFDGGRADAHTVELDAQRRAVESDRSEFERRIRLDVELARTSLVGSLAEVSAADAARRAAEARLEAEEERLDAGMATASDVLEAQAELADAERQQIAARARSRIAAATLDRAVGR